MDQIGPKTAHFESCDKTDQKSSGSTLSDHYLTQKHKINTNPSQNNVEDQDFVRFGLVLDKLEQPQLTSDVFFYPYLI